MSSSPGSALLAKTAIPLVVEQSALLEAVAGDEWWIDVNLSMLELARLRLRGLVRFIEKTKRNPICTDFEDTLDDATEIELPGVVPGTNFERFRAKAAAYLKEHEDHVALQRLRRNKQLTPADLTALEEMLIVSGAGQMPDIALASAKWAVSACLPAPWLASTGRPRLKPLQRTSTARSSPSIKCAS